MSRLSIIIPTLRAGGLDIIFSSLNNQTTFDFELIIVDSLFYMRRDEVDRRPNHYFFPVKHVPPLGMTHGSVLESVAYQRAMNTGLAHSVGDLVMFTTDFAWFPPECVQSHINFHANNNGLGCIGSYDYTSLPPLHPDWPKNYGPRGLNYSWWLEETHRMNLFAEWHRSYKEDLPNLSKFMWSVFESQIGSSFDISSLPVTESESRRMENEFLEPRFCYLKHDSFRTADVLEINGFDEGMDGSHAYQDVEFAKRMNARKGTKYKLDLNNRIKVIDPHPIMYIRDLKRPETSNGERCSQRESTSFSAPTNDWSISDKRRELYNI